jgi:hypothetical protein
MATLTGSTIAGTYLTLLKLTSAALGADASAKYIEDAAGTDSALSLSTTRVGIGTASPAADLEIVGGASVDAHLTLVGTEGQVANLCLWADDGDDATDGWEIQSNTGGNLFIKKSTGNLASSSGLGTYGTEVMTLAADGNVGIGTTSPGNSLLKLESSTSTYQICEMKATNATFKNMLYIDNVNGAADDTSLWFIRMDDSGGPEAYVFSDGSHNQVSDVRRKKNIINTEPQLDKLNQVRVVNYNRKNDVNEGLHIGIIAQELKEIYPHLVNTADDEAESLMVYKTGFFAILIKAVQELSAKVTALENA